MGFLDLNVLEARGGERLLKLALGECAGDAPGVLGHVALGGLVHVFVGDYVADGEAAARLEHARCFAQVLVLVAGEIDDAVLMITSTESSARGISSMVPLTNWAFSTPASAAFLRARSSISSRSAR